MGTVLVTGGAGYIGSHCTHALVQAGWEVVVYDDLTSGSEEFVPKEARFFCGDIMDERLVDYVIKRYQVESVMHFAALTQVEESVRQPDRYHHINCLGTSRLVKTAMVREVRHFVLSSTAAVYGTPALCPVSEDAPLEPGNPYALSKMRAERDVRDSYRGSDNHPQRCGTHAILRYFNVAGVDPKGRGGYQVAFRATHLVRRAILAAVGEVSELTVFGTDYPTPDGTAVRDYVHVADVAQAHVAALERLRQGEASRTFNVGYGRGYTVLEVIEAVKRISGSNFPVVFAKRRPGDAAAVVADPSRIKKELNWQPQYDDLDTIIRHEYVWVQAQLAK